MRSKSINVHALMDESEDLQETLEAYFNTTVLNLTDKPSTVPLQVALAPFAKSIPVSIDSSNEINSV